MAPNKAQIVIHWFEGGENVASFIRAKVMQKGFEFCGFKNNNIFRGSDGNFEFSTNYKDYNTGDFIKILFVLGFSGPLDEISERIHIKSLTKIKEDGYESVKFWDDDLIKIISEYIFKIFLKDWEDFKKTGATDYKHRLNLFRQLLSGESIVVNTIVSEFYKVREKRVKSKALERLIQSCINQRLSLKDFEKRAKEQGIELTETDKKLYSNWVRLAGPKVLSKIIKKRPEDLYPGYGFVKKAKNKKTVVPTTMFPEVRGAIKEKITHEEFFNNLKKTDEVRERRKGLKEKLKLFLPKIHFPSFKDLIGKTKKMKRIHDIKKEVEKAEKEVIRKVGRDKAEKMIIHWLNIEIAKIEEKLINFDQLSPEEQTEVYKRYEEIVEKYKKAMKEAEKI